MFFRKSALLTAVLVGCVPSGSAPSADAGPSSQNPTPSSRPSINVMTAPFEDNFDRPDAAAEESANLLGSAADASPLPGIFDGGARDRREGAAANRDGSSVLAAGDAEVALGDRDAGSLAALIRDASPKPERNVGNLGPNWTQARTNAWKIENGRLCGQGAHNHGVWLNRVLPVNARIEFDAIALSNDGDLKTEVWGDGQSAATTVSYNNATSYLAILGGWKNTLHVLARVDEHGKDRKELRVDPESDDPRQKPVIKDQVYRFKVERTDGRTVRFFVDGVEYHSYVDPAPLTGMGHDHFGFNEWEAKVCFDNVKVTPL